MHVFSWWVARPGGGSLAPPFDVVLVFHLHFVGLDTLELCMVRWNAGFRGAKGLRI